MAEINILDCTLRDGGYVNNWQFNDNEIIQIVDKLANSNLEIIECGFLDNVTGGDANSTRFKDIKKLNHLMDSIKVSEDQLLVAMLEHGKYDVDSLPDIGKTEHIRGIRYSFRKSDFRAALLEMPKIMAKGYKLFVQPISTNSYSDEELTFLLNEMNILMPYAVYIVDTQGSMYKDDFRTLYYKFDKILNKSISMGFHSHNNMQLSYSIAIDFIEIARFRHIIIDSSVYGMGRGAGNLNTELLADYINKKIDSKYNVEILLGLIDTYFYAIYNESKWGYSLAHLLSATLECHPNYASFLLDTKHLTITDIKAILSEIPRSESYEFNKNLIQDMYIDYNMGKAQKDIFYPILDKDKTVLLIGSGPSVSEKTNYINENREKYTIIALNHIPKNIDVDYYFFNTQKRYDEFSKLLNSDKVITTSNIQSDAKFILDYKNLSMIDNYFNDNAVVNFINYLVQKKYKNVDIAGVDGFLTGQDNYIYPETDRVVDKESMDKLNESIATGLDRLSSKIEISFLTETIFKLNHKPRVIGIIPARYGSTRLPGKPLKDIEGLPMVVHVMKRAMMCKDLDDVLVATDDERIVDMVENFGGKAMMTSKDHPDANYRMQEVSTKIDGDIFVLINGDEPLLDHNDIKKSIQGLIDNPKVSASLLVTPYTERNNFSNLKIVLNHNDEVMYISRSDIPSDARVEKQPMWKGYYIVSFTKNFLDKYTCDLKDSPLNDRESTNENKILEYGYKIKAIKTDTNALSVDTQEDLEVVRKMMKTDKLFQLYKGLKID